MRVGILTFHRALNFGAVLQCYALQVALQKFNVEVEVIDYKNEFIQKFYSPFYIEKYNWKKIAYMLYAFKSKYVRNKTFHNFRESYLCLSTDQYSKDNIGDANSRYDAIIVGSDQVWNLEQTDGDVNYLLSFADKEKSYSYAASFGIDSIHEDIRLVYYKNLQNFKGISVRESSGVNIIADILGVEVEQHIDPTLLLEQEEWEKLANQGIREQGKYICVYKINMSKCYMYAEELEKRTGIRVIVIKPDKTCPSHFAKYKNASPEDFLALIKNAEYVITDSFHGIVFSTVFKKKFVTCLDSRINNKNTRITEILKAYRLEDRLIKVPGMISRIDQDIDYAKMNAKLADEKRVALTYLERICNR